MKRLRLFSLVFMVAVAGMVFAACSSDDGGGDSGVGDKSSQLVGSWSCEDDDSEMILSFAADGTCSFREYINGSMSDEAQGVYIVNDKKLTIKLRFSDATETWIYTIKSVRKGAKLVLTDEDDESYAFTYYKDGDDSDDGDTTFKSSDLVGGYWTYTQGANYNGWTDFTGTLTEFYSDGTCSYLQYDDGEVIKQEKGSYIVKGDKLVVYFESVNNTYTIKLLKKKSRMVLYNDGDGYADTYINSMDKGDDTYNSADLTGGSWVDDEGYKYVFRADGTFTETDGGYEAQGYYSVSGNKLKTFDNKGYSDTYRIISLQKKKELILLDEKHDTHVYSYKK